MAQKVAFFAPNIPSSEVAIIANACGQRDKRGDHFLSFVTVLPSACLGKTIARFVGQETEKR
jgi:hypothetical protein